MAALDPSVFGRAWLHSSEEDRGGKTVYRPEEFPFPPTRGGREGFRLAADGVAVALAPGATDRLEEAAAGRWEMDPAGRLVLFLNDGASPDHVFEVVSADPERLVVKG